MTLDWWTLGIQAVNVTVLIWLLGRFFWRPMAAIIAERRAVAERSLADAQRARAEAAEALAAIERTRAAEGSSPGAQPLASRGCRRGPRGRLPARQR